MVTSTVIEQPKAKLYNFFKQVTPEAKATHAAWAPKLEAFASLVASFTDEDHLAEHLETLGIQGRIGSSISCPLACWAQQEIGNPRIRVSTTISLRHDGPTATSVIDTPPVGIRFYRAFDSYSYPKLHIRGARGELR